MGLQQNLNDIQTNLLAAKTAIAQSINNKGVECSATDKLSTFASKIDSITTGSTGGTGEKFVVPNGLNFGYSIAFDPTIFDVSQVTYMNDMFSNCSRLTSIDLSGWNTSKVTDMRSMFYYCTGLTSIDLSGWNTSKVTDMDGMFLNCSRLTSIDLSSFSLISCTKVTDIFRFDINLANLQLPDLGHNQDSTSLDLSTCLKLTKDSVLYLFNNAFDRATAGYSKAFTIKLNATTKALLSEDEIAIATNKGFTVV